jgi:chemotaxis protein MotB
MRLPVLILTITLAGCVSSGTYDQKVAELTKLHADAAKACGDSELALEKRIAALEAERDDLGKRLATTMTERDEARGKLDNELALDAALKDRLEHLGQNVEKLTSEKGQLDVALTDAKGRLEELRRQKVAAEARLATWRGLVGRLRGMIDAGQIKVVIRNGRMLVALPNDVLFDSGSAQIKPAGQGTLAKVATALATIPDRSFVVAGHTDDVPIRTERFPSNWELSTARAVEVTKFLVQSGLRPRSLAAAGYGEFDPVAANDSAEHRAQNRRIEIVLEPNLSELPSLDEIMTQASR